MVYIIRVIVETAAVPVGDEQSATGVGLGQVRERARVRVRVRGRVSTWLP